MTRICKLLQKYVDVDSVIGIGEIRPQHDYISSRDQMHYFIVHLKGSQMPISGGSFDTAYRLRQRLLLEWIKDAEMLGFSLEDIS